MTNNADPDQLASEEANWSGSTLFAKAGHVVFSKRRLITYILEESNFSFSYVRIYNLDIPVCKQWRPWSDAAFFGVWSGSALFANSPFGYVQTKMG